MRNGTEPSAVRLLRSDDIEPIDPLSPPADQPRKWFVPLLVVGSVLALFLFATRPADPNAAASTTLPPSLAAVEAQQIDLTTPPVDGNTSGEWSEGSFEWRGRINDVLNAGRTFVAVGWTPEGARAWLSGTGASWTEVATLELPDTPNTSLDHAVMWHGDLVVLGSVDDGIGLWTAPTLSSWFYQGQIESMGTSSISRVAAGNELLAISTDDRPIQGWMSSDGLEWRPLGPLSDLDGAQAVRTLTATDRWYFAGGQGECNDIGCYPVIYRSADGITWERTDGEMSGQLSTENGAVVDMTTTADGLVAVGSVGRLPNTEMAVWKSSDGSSWERVGAGTTAFAPSSITVEVLATRPGGNPTASISIDGSKHEVTVGSEIVTDGGAIPVADVFDSYLLMGATGSRQRIPLEAPTEIVATGLPWQIVAEGPRVVIAGTVVSEYTDSPAIWTSVDSGSTWSRVVQPGASGGAIDTAVAGSNIVAFGEASASGIPVIWHTTWNTEAAGATAVDALRAYLEALDSHDADALVELLPQVHNGSGAPAFEIPSLDSTGQDWWDPDTGLLDIDRVAATVEYLEGTETSIGIGDCTPTVSLGAVDRAGATCGFAVDSTLLDTLGYRNGAGSIHAAVVNGSLASVELRVSPAVEMWSTLGAVVSDASEADRATLVAETELGRSILAPTFNGATAVIHIRLAEKFVEGQFRPGDTRIIDTVLGTMEWRWIDPIDMPVSFFEWVTWTESGFLATAGGRPGEFSSDFSVWTSADGLDWIEVPAPEGFESLWGLEPFLDGVAGQAWKHDEQSIAYFDGAEWLEIALPAAESRLQDPIMYMAVGKDRILSIGGSWDEQRGSILEKAWMIGSDLVPREVDLPTTDDWTEANIELAATDDGFVVSVSRFDGSQEISIWHTTDGTDWRLIADSVRIDDARFVYNLQQHRLRYFVSGEGVEPDCSNTVVSPVCETTAGVWSSRDGVAWEKVRAESGEGIAAYGIGSGDLGLVTFGQPSDDATLPRSVYLSRDGQTWERVSNLSLFYPGVTWWWLTQPAVGGETIVAPGLSFQESNPNNESPFLIVGRVIDK